MTTPQIMPLEETVKQLTGWLSMEPFDDALVLHVRSALHHLEAGKRGCQCREWKQFGDLLRPVKVAEHADGSSTWRSTCPTPDFCPWCGGKLTTPTNEQG